MTEAFVSVVGYMIAESIVSVNTLFRSFANKFCRLLSDCCLSESVLLYNRGRPRKRPQLLPAARSQRLYGIVQFSQARSAQALAQIYSDTSGANVHLIAEDMLKDYPRRSEKARTLTRARLSYPARPAGLFLLYNVAADRQQTDSNQEEACSTPSSRGIAGRL